MNDTYDDDDEPRDPDWDDVPAELADHDGEVVEIIEPDGSYSKAMIVVSPGAFGDARRRREGDDSDGAA